MFYQFGQLYNWGKIPKVEIFTIFFFITRFFTLITRNRNLNKLWGGRGGVPAPTAPLVSSSSYKRRRCCTKNKLWEKEIVWMSTATKVLRCHGSDEKIKRFAFCFWGMQLGWKEGLRLNKKISRLLQTCCCSIVMELIFFKRCPILYFYV